MRVEIGAEETAEEPEVIELAAIGTVGKDGVMLGRKWELEVGMVGKGQD